MILLENVYSFGNSFLKSIITILKVVFRSKLFVKIPRVKNGSCIILANGPSLTTTIENHKVVMTNSHLICVNHFPETVEFSELKPSYLIISAPEFWLEKVSHKIEIRRKALFHSLITKTNWELSIFCPYKSKNSKLISELPKLNSYLSINYYNDTPIEGFTQINHKLFDLKLGIPRPQNVLIPSLMIAIIMGFKNIFVVGADHSWLEELFVNDQNEALLNQKHFYDEQTSRPATVNMDEFGKPRRLHEILYKIMMAFKAYFSIQNYANSKNVKIYNSTPRSYIDAFERKKMSEFDHNE